MSRKPQPGDLHRVHQIKLRLPPEGFPAVLGEWVYTHAETGCTYPYTCQEERTLQEVSRVLGVHASTHVTTPSPPPASQSNEQRARHRMRNLRQRMERRYPLFAEQMIAEEIARKPAYFRGERENAAEYEALMAEWRADYERWQAKAAARAGASGEKAQAAGG